MSSLVIGEGCCIAENMACISDVDNLSIHETLKIKAINVEDVEMSISILKEDEVDNWKIGVKSSKLLVLE